MKTNQLTNLCENILNQKYMLDQMQKFLLKQVHKFFDSLPKNFKLCVREKEIYITKQGKEEEDSFYLIDTIYKKNGNLIILTKDCPEVNHGYNWEVKRLNADVQIQVAVMLAEESELLSQIEQMTKYFC